MIRSDKHGNRARGQEEKTRPRIWSPPGRQPAISDGLDGKDGNRDQHRDFEQGGGIETDPPPDVVGGSQAAGDRRTRQADPVVAGRAR